MTNPPSRRRDPLWTDTAQWLSPVYALGWLVWAFRLCELVDGPSTPGVICAGATVWGVYLIDRHRLTSSMVEEGAQAPVPAWRVCGVLCLLMGAASAWALHPVAVLLPVSGLLAVLAYGGRARGDGLGRWKNIPVLKNALVAAGFAILSTSLLAIDAPVPAARMALVFGCILAIVGTDAALSDLDDVDPDRERGTRTLPVLLGRGRAIACIAAVFALGGAAVLAMGPRDRGSLDVVVMLWPSLSGLAVLGVGAVRPRLRLRTLIDARMGLVPLALLS